MGKLTSLLMSCLLVPTVAAQHRATIGNSPSVRHDSEKKSVASEPACPDRRGWTGRYRNYVFGFSFIIPRGLTGYWNSAPCAESKQYGCLCLNDHGRVIPLSDNAHIEVFVGYQMESDWSVRDHERQEIFYLRSDKGKQQVEVTRSVWFRLGSLHARRFEARYVRDGKPRLIDHIVALHEEVEYELILVTSPDRYEADRQQFEKIISSWRLTRRI